MIKCANCGEQVHITNYAMGAEWTHPGDPHDEIYCKIHRATPEDHEVSGYEASLIKAGRL